MVNAPISSRRLALYLTLVLLSWPVSAWAQNVKVGTTCWVRDAKQVSQPQWVLAPSEGGGRSAPLDPNRSPEYLHPLWDSRQGAITLADLAHLAAPILLFSPREFLLLGHEGDRAGIPAPIPRDGGTRPDVGPGRVVYYRVREVRLRRPWRPDGSGPSIGDDGFDVARSVATKWSCDGSGGYPLDELDRIFIRYFLYYPRDKGVGGHVHDLESLEVQIRSRPFCDTVGTTDGEASCFYGLTVASVSASAHGAGWYTNILNVEDAPDTVLPLSVLVEENKHATSPDRDGDGAFMPHYDTNLYSHDAWGIRDVVGSGWLGGASFHAEHARRRRWQERVSPPRPSRALRELYELTPPFPDHPWSAEHYELEQSVLHPLCLGSSEPMAGRRTTRRGDRDFDRLWELMRDKDFCGDTPTSVVRYGRPRLWLDQLLNQVSPGPRYRYGFTSYWQRFSVSGRSDGGLGVTAIIPLGHEMPLFGGWLVGKVSAVPIWSSWKDWQGLRSVAVDALYTPSGSRVTDWYVAGGAERWRQEPGDPLRWGPAGEIGVRLRFNVEKLKGVLGFQFVGFRAGLRTTTQTGAAGEDGTRERLVRTRLVFEFGAGSW